jgi:hypothetical protein
MELSWTSKFGARRPANINAIVSDIESNLVDVYFGAGDTSNRANQVFWRKAGAEHIMCPR